MPDVRSCRRSRRRAAPDDQAGSGTAIGVAIVFPMLLLVIVVISGITFASRSEQALQAAADRAARTASLCCLHVGDAGEAAQLSIATHQFSMGRGLDCANDVAAGAVIRFESVGGTDVPELDSNGDPNVVPAGGHVTVVVSCRLRPDHVGVSSMLAANAMRWASGVATVDPSRHRSMTVTP